jgi:hypothetical protein
VRLVLLADQLVEGRLSLRARSMSRLNSA